VRFSVRSSLRALFSRNRDTASLSMLSNVYILRNFVEFPATICRVIVGKVQERADLR
jgi:hypothetical protein